MKFYGVDMQGDFQIEDTATKPVYVPVTDDRRIIRCVDGGVTKLFLGVDGLGWIDIQIDNGDTAPNNTIVNWAENTFHVLGGSTTETFVAESFLGTDPYAELAAVRVSDDWIKLSNGDPVSTGDVAGLRIEYASPTSDLDDIKMFYSYDASPETVGGVNYPTNWLLDGGGGGIGYTNDPIATHALVDAKIANSLSLSNGYLNLTQMDARFVRYANVGDTPQNTTWISWKELTDNTIGATRNIYRVSEAHAGFVRCSDWPINSPAGTATYATSSNVASTVVMRDASRNIYANIGYLTASSAYYADLAENYTCATFLPVGTVMEVSDDDEFEVVPCIFELSPTVVGVISENPAYLMNSGSEGKPVALTGKVPVRVLGAINKGDFVVPAGDGLARKGEPHELVFKFGVALETNLQGDEKLVKCIIK